MAQHLTGKDLPADKFDGDLSMTFAATVVKALTDKSERVLMVPYARLQPLPGFNVRVRDEAYNERVKMLAQSMVENGFYPHRPLGGILLDTDHEHMFIHDGQTRYDAVAVAVEMGASITDIPVVVAPKGTSIEDLTVSLVQSNDGAPLKPVELAAVVKRLSGYGMDKAKIAARISRSERHVDNLLVLAGAPVSVRAFVAEDRIAAAEAVKLLRKDAKSAPEKIKAAVEKAEASGKRKATPRTLSDGDSGGQGGTGTPEPKMLRQRVEISLATGTKLGDALKAAAKHVRANVAHAADDSDALQEDGKLIVIVEVLDRTPPAEKAPDPDALLAAAPAAKPKPAGKPAAAKGAATGRTAAAKPAQANKPKTTKAPAEAPAAAAATTPPAEPAEGAPVAEAAGVPTKDTGTGAADQPPATGDENGGL